VRAPQTRVRGVGQQRQAPPRAVTHDRQTGM
jgi:hypothetical protein